MLANDGHKHALDRVLDLAYGRKGPLRWCIMTVSRAVHICMNRSKGSLIALTL